MNGGHDRVSPHHQPEQHAPKRDDHGVSVSVGDSVCGDEAKCREDREHDEIWFHSNFLSK